MLDGGGGVISQLPDRINGVQWCYVVCSWIFQLYMNPTFRCGQLLERLVRTNPSLQQRLVQVPGPGTSPKSRTGTSPGGRRVTDLVGHG